MHDSIQYTSKANSDAEIWWSSSSTTFFFFSSNLNTYNLFFFVCIDIKSQTSFCYSDHIELCMFSILFAYCFDKCYYWFESPRKRRKSIILLFCKPNSEKMAQICSWNVLNVYDFILGTDSKKVSIVNVNRFIPTLHFRSM